MRRSIITSVMATFLPALVVGTVATADGTSGITDSPARTWGTNGARVLRLAVGASVIVGGDSTAVTDTNGRSYPAARLAKYLPASALRPHLGPIDHGTGVCPRLWVTGCSSVGTSASWTGVHTRPWARSR